MLNNPQYIEQMLKNKKWKNSTFGNIALSWKPRLLIKMLKFRKRGMTIGVSGSNSIKDIRQWGSMRYIKISSDKTCKRISMMSIAICITSSRIFNNKRQTRKEKTNKIVLLRLKGRESLRKRNSMRWNKNRSIKRMLYLPQLSEKSNVKLN